MIRRATPLAVALVLLAASTARAAVTPPVQPKSGPGGSAYTHADWRVTPGGTGADAWYVFEPVKPRPKSAPVTVVMHGYYEYAGYKQMAGFIRHTVRGGSIVIYPRWQTDIAAPCPGPFNIEPCVTSATNAIHGALAYLRSGQSRVQPDVGKASYFGFSFGGILTANLTNRYRKLHLPKPRAIFLDDPHDGGLNGFGEPVLDHSLAGIPASVKFECHSGTDGVISETGKADSSCNAVFPKLKQVPARNKSLVLTHTDAHGRPTLSSKHGVCAGGPEPDGLVAESRPNAYDWNFCWKVWDALRSCAITGTDCRYALGSTPAHRSMGRWSDGTAITPLKIQTTAPIRP